MSILNTNLTGYTFTYNSINNKLTIKRLINEFQLMQISSCSILIGFLLSSSNFSSSLSLTSTNCIDLFPINIVYVSSNLLTYNINKSTSNNQSVLCAIPIFTQPYSVIQYHNYNNFKSNLFINSLSSITIKLLDEYGNAIDLNGCHFNLTLQLDIIQFN